MELVEAQLIIDYFHTATPEHLELLGVDPTRLPDPGMWMDGTRRITKVDRGPRVHANRVGDERRTGGVFDCRQDSVRAKAFMHLHIVDALHRRAGTGVRCLRETVRLYFDLLQARPFVLRAQRVQ